MENISPEDRRLMVERVLKARDDLESARTDYVLRAAESLSNRGLRPGADFQIVMQRKPGRIFPEPLFSVSWEAYHRRIIAGAMPLPPKPFLDGRFCFHA